MCKPVFLSLSRHTGVQNEQKALYLILCGSFYWRENKYSPCKQEDHFLVHKFAKRHSWWCLYSVITLGIRFCIQVNIVNPYTLITFYCEWWPSHRQVVCIYQELLSIPTRVWISHQPCDLLTGGVITHRILHELKRIMRFVNKRRPFWQQPTHLPSSMVSFDRCVWADVCLCIYVLPATIDGDKEQFSSKKLPLILLCSLFSSIR